MIKLIKYPAANVFLLDSNNTLIEIKSTNGLGHFFRAKIYVDNILFDEQNWSREDNFTARKDLKFLYKAYFEPKFNSVNTSGIFERTDLIKKITIVIDEFNLSTNLLTQTINLPEFYIFYGDKPSVFSPNNPLQFLETENKILRIPNNGLIKLPFYSIAANNSITCNLKLNTNVVIFTNTISSVSGPKIHELIIDLSLIIIPINALYLTVNIIVGTFSIAKTYRLFKNENYSIKQIAYMNNFGYFIHAYFDGQLKKDNTYKHLKYTEFDDNEKISDISTASTYRLNTGSLLGSEKVIVNEICNSVDAKIKLDGIWYSINTETKKSNIFEDNKNLYDEDLIFNLAQNKSINNQGIIEVLVSEIELQNIEIQGNSAIVTFVFNLGYTCSSLILRLIDGASIVNIPISITSPEIVLTIPVGTYIAKLISADNSAIISNSINFNILPLDFYLFSLTQVVTGAHPWNVVRMIVNNNSQIGRTVNKYIFFKNLNNLLEDVNPYAMAAGTSLDRGLTLPSQGLWYFYFSDGTFKSNILSINITF